MTIRELRDVTRPIAARLEELSREAEGDDFAPWVVAALRHAAHYATLSEVALNAFKGDDE
jgi:hypothetical protein